MLRGRIYHIFGDHIDTDVIIPGRYLNIQNPQDLAKHCFEELVPNFSAEIRKGDIIIAGATLDVEARENKLHWPKSIGNFGNCCCLVCENILS